METYSIYKVIYQNGFEQIKLFVPHIVYWGIYKKITDKVSELNEAPKQNKEHINNLKELLTGLFGNYVILPKSGPMWEAIHTGILVRTVGNFPVRSRFIEDCLL